MVGKVTVIDLQQRKIVAVVDTGPESNHPNFVILDGINHAFVTLGGLNETKVYRQQYACELPVYVGAVKSSGVQPHGIWPSPDNTRIYIVNEHSDTVDVIDTSTLKVIHTLEVGQEGQALVYDAEGVTSGNGTQNLGRQGLNYNIENRAIPMSNRSNSRTLITVRQVSGLDMVQFIASDIQGNTTYAASASCLNYNGVRIPLLEFKGKANSHGVVSAGQVLGVFKFFSVYDLNSVSVEPV